MNYRENRVWNQSIIKPDWIVTAAHCFQSNPNTADYKVIAGELNLKKKEGDEQVMDIEKIIEHPKYDESKRPKYDYDIKLLKLKTKIQFNDKVRPICLPTKRFKDGGNCYATGWGYTKDFKGNKNLKASTTLQQLKIPLVSDKTCKYAFSSMTSRMICGGYKDKGKGICKGDSGGPLACKNKSGIWDLAGAMSFVLGSCAQQNTYDFFTNIHELKGWIEDQVNKN
ncbi:Coagulation factor XI [Exaiptasia diaphana]|nr:Coagulation factor XI [Exaiptasia diaphana]